MLIYDMYVSFIVVLAATIVIVAIILVCVRVCPCLCYPCYHRQCVAIPVDPSLACFTASLNGYLCARGVYAYTQFEGKQNSHNINKVQMGVGTNNQTDAATSITHPLHHR